jgi:adenosylhomocysteine nucleosidase
VPRIAIFAALQWECRPILRHLRQARRGNIGEVPTWSTTHGPVEIVVAKTGIGLVRAAAAARTLAQSEPFDLFLSSGCAGALAAHLCPGDVIVADRVRTLDGDALPVDDEQRQRSLAVLQRSGLQRHQGTIVSSPTILATPAEKTAAAHDGALAVDMEGAAIAAVAAASGIPFGAVRSILDRADLELDHAGRFVDPATGAVRPGALAAHLLRHPTAVGSLLAMKKMMDAAQASLDRFFAEYLAC